MRSVISTSTHQIRSLQLPFFSFLPFASSALTATRLSSAFATADGWSSLLRFPIHYQQEASVEGMILRLSVPLPVRRQSMWNQTESHGKGIGVCHNGQAVHHASNLLYREVVLPEHQQIVVFGRILVSPRKPLAPALILVVTITFHRQTKES